MSPGRESRKAKKKRKGRLVSRPAEPRSMEKLFTEIQAMTAEELQKKVNELQARTLAELQVIITMPPYVIDQLDQLVDLNKYCNAAIPRLRKHFDFLLVLLSCKQKGRQITEGSRMNVEWAMVNDSEVMLATYEKIKETIAQPITRWLNMKKWS